MAKNIEVDPLMRWTKPRHHDLWDPPRDRFLLTGSIYSGCNYLRSTGIGILPVPEVNTKKLGAPWDYPWKHTEVPCKNPRKTRVYPPCNIYSIHSLPAESSTEQCHNKHPWLDANESTGVPSENKILNTEDEDEDEDEDQGSGLLWWWWGVLWTL